MSEEINDVINNLCEKFGTTVTELAPEMARYEITTSAVALIISTIFLCVLVLVWRATRKRYWECLDRDDYEKTSDANVIYTIMTAIMTFCTIAYILMVLSNATDIAGWIASPRAALIKEIAGMLE